MRPKFTREEFEILSKEASKYPAYSVKRWEVYLRADLAKVFGDYPDEPLTEEQIKDIFEEPKASLNNVIDDSPNN